MIVVPRSFQKKLSRFGTDIRAEILSLISRHHRWLAKNLFVFKHHKDMEILKGYLDGKRIRIIVAVSRDAYILLEIVKKESRDGYNIRGDRDISAMIGRIDQEIDNDEYEVWKIESYKGSIEAVVASYEKEQGEKS